MMIQTNTYRQFNETITNVFLMCELVTYFKSHNYIYQRSDADSILAFIPEADIEQFKIDYIQLQNIANEKESNLNNDIKILSEYFNGIAMAYTDSYAKICCRIFNDNEPIISISVPLSKNGHINWSLFKTILKSNEYTIENIFYTIRSIYLMTDLTVEETHALAVKYYNIIQSCLEKVETLCG